VSSRRARSTSTSEGTELLAADWSLSDKEQEAALRHRGPANRLGFAVQLCALRRRGRFIEDYRLVPSTVLGYLARHLGIELVLSLEPPRPATETARRRRVMEVLGWHAFDAKARKRLTKDLGAIARAHHSVDDLVAEAERLLRERQVVAPAVATLRRIAGPLVTRARRNLLAEITKQLTAKQRRRLDELLVVSAEESRSPLAFLQEHPPEGRPPDIKEHIARYRELSDLRAAELDLSGINEQVVAEFAEVARRHDAHALRRFSKVKQHALLACFLSENIKTVLDQIVAMHDQCMGNVIRWASNKAKQKEQEARERSRRSLRMALDALEFILDPEAEQDLVVTELFVRYEPEELRGALADCREFERLDRFGFVNELRRRQTYLKQYLPALVSLPFEGEPGTESLMRAIGIARQLTEGELRALPDDAPDDIGPPSWRRILRRKDKTLDPAMWDVCLMGAIRDSLRSGDLYLPESRHHVSFWNLVYSEEQWERERKAAYERLGVPASATDALAALREEFEAAVETTAANLDDNSFASVVDGALVLHRQDAYREDRGVAQLRRALGAYVPRIPIEKLIAQVDAWCGFSRELTPLIDTVRPDEHYQPLLAAVVAHGSNLGVEAMGESVEGLTPRMLSRTSRWFLRPETLRAANRCLVDFHHHLPLSAVWGSGKASSSDGQRFGVQASSILASLYPRYFGFYDRALTVYTHTSDQHSVFASRAISCRVREASFVLDGLLENDTVLGPREHYTDTHGSTEHLFGLCYLLGFSFMPRLKDLKDQQLYRLDRLDQRRDYGGLGPLLGRRANFELIGKQWDQLVRVAASLRNQTAPAHVVLQRLSASAPSDLVAKALRELGRVVKTIYILRYLDDAELRGRVHRQLNRTEQRHALAKRLFFANQGIFRTGALPEIMNKVSALSLLSNAVLIWNTVALAEGVRTLRAGGTEVRDEDVARISPIAYAHVIPTGTYRFPTAPAAPSEPSMILA